MNEHELIVQKWIEEEAEIEARKQAEIKAELEAKEQAEKTVKDWIRFEKANPDKCFVEGAPDAEEVRVDKLIF